MTLREISEINKCVEDVRAGAPQAVEKLHKLIGNRLFFIALRYMGNKPDAEDLVQDFWKDIKTYCEKMRFSLNALNYLLKVLENLAKMRLRSEKVRRTAPLEAVNEYDSAIIREESTDRQIALHESFERAKAKMSEKEKLVFALSCYEELTVREIAKELGVSKSAAHRLRQSSYEILKAVLTEDGWDKNDE